MGAVGWDGTFDVVVVGYGGAGAAAAISAAQRGAKVAVLEKAPSGGGNTAMSYNYFYPDDRESAVEYLATIKKLEAPQGSDVDRRLLEAFVDGAMENPSWIRSLGGKSTEPGAPRSYPAFPQGPSFPLLPGARSIHQYKVEGKSPLGGANLFELLSERVRSLGVEVWFNSPAVELVTDAIRRVVGVEYEKGGRRGRLKARRGVVLACGGFEFSDQLKSEHLPGGPYFALGATENTGDGIGMAAKVGASMWHMRCVAAFPAFKPDRNGRALTIFLKKPSFVHVDKYGLRFMNECDVETHLSYLPLTYFDPLKLEYPRIPCYLVFDSSNMAAPLSTDGWPNSEWSRDNQAELTKGWIAQGESLEKLEEKLRLPPNSLVGTVRRFNGFSLSGHDLDFGRKKQDLAPIESPPFYAIKLWPTLLNTQGGPRHDERGRVLDASGDPIAGLYEAGELGSFWGILYQSAGNLAEAMAFGRIAGANAALEPAGD